MDRNMGGRANIENQEPVAVDIAGNNNVVSSCIHIAEATMPINVLVTDQCPALASRQILSVSELEIIQFMRETGIDAQLTVLKAIRSARMKLKRAVEKS